MEKMERHKIVIISNESGDWQGMYIDGELKEEGHSLGIYQIFQQLQALDKPLDYEDGSCTDEEMEKHGYSFPYLLSNLKYE